MISTKISSTSTNSSTGTQSASRARIGKSNTVSRTGKVEQSIQSTEKNAYLKDFSERPKLITELSDMHKLHSAMSISLELLRKIVSSIISIKKIIQKGEFSPELLNQIDIKKKEIMESLETKAFGNYVLDSSFKPVSGVTNWIEFTVPGLDFRRERLTNELVTLYVNGFMVPLAFDRTLTVHQLVTLFQKQAGYNNMTLRMDSERHIVLGLQDSQWRVWDGMIFVSGQAGRFASGQPMSFQVNALEPTIEDVTRLDLREPTSLNSLEPVITQVNKIYRNLATQLKNQGEDVEQLLALCQAYDGELMNQTQSLMSQKPARAAMSIHRNYNGPSRENVINLLEE